MVGSKLLTMVETIRLRYIVVPSIEPEYWNGKDINMCEMSESFIWLSGAAWTGLNTLATFAAVIVALYLPKYQEIRQNKNISVLIEKELEGNYSLLEKTETMPRLDFKVAVAEHISLKIWNELKYSLAVCSAEKYRKFEDANVVLEKILVLRSDFLANVEPKKTVATQVIEGEISTFLRKYRETH